MAGALRIQPVLRGPPWLSIVLRVESLLVEHPTTPVGRMFTRLPWRWESRRLPAHRRRIRFCFWHAANMTADALTARAQCMDLPSYEVAKS